MPELRFAVGATVLCNFGPSGWKLGRIIALHYREPEWPAGQVVPYQVLLEADQKLIYVPRDDPRYCREATPEDRRIARRPDALAALPPDPDAAGDLPAPAAPQMRARTGLDCSSAEAAPGSPGYRSGQCECCGPCPQHWSAAELYSEHYRCAARNGIPVTQCGFDLGTLQVGDTVHHPPGATSGSGEGFLQSPMLVRLPPGLRFSDDGGLTGTVQFDPHRSDTYAVEFVAVSTARWDDPAVGIVRMEIAFVVEGNTAPAEFDRAAFEETQQEARTTAERLLHDISDTWALWERQALSNRRTCDQILAALDRLRSLLEQHPRLDGGQWWLWLGGFHMNVHKLLENTLFECELYLGHALTFSDPNVRRMAEQNLAGCYSKRRLEAARFLWIDGMQQMIDGEWVTAADTFHRAADLQDGWGWAVNYGDIWMGEAAARLVHGATLAVRSGGQDAEALPWISASVQLLEKAVQRSSEAGVFGPGGHPWVAELTTALRAYRDLVSQSADLTDWLEAFQQRTVYWCAQVLSGTTPFPPKPRPRLESAADLIARLPGHNP
ncbi:MAG: hypothetical protein CL927_14590 [Deltaproteobacteria bacterium]|nr:hypothetical protein [Deltaproteobacteria bacterium]HCH63814.1 hypothetical protein [Deltaproteobacteria bacterium]